MREDETTTQLASQTVDEDDDMQNVGQTRRPDSPSVMMPADVSPPTNPTTGPLLNRKPVLIYFNFIIYIKLMNLYLSTCGD